MSSKSSDVYDFLVVTIVLSLHHSKHIVQYCPKFVKRALHSQHKWLFIRQSALEIFPQPYQPMIRVYQLSYSNAAIGRANGWLACLH
jgi:hypothetical protein